MTTATSYIRVVWRDSFCRSITDEDLYGEQVYPWTDKGQAEAEAFAKSCGGEVQFCGLLPG